MDTNLDRLRIKLLALLKERGENLKEFAEAIVSGDAFRQTLRHFLYGRSRAGETEPRAAGLGKYRVRVEQWLLTHHNFSLVPTANERLADLKRRIKVTPLPTPREEFRLKLVTDELAYVEIWRGRIVAETRSGDRIHYPDNGVVNPEDFEAFAPVLTEDQRAEFLEYLGIEG